MSVLDTVSSSKEVVLYNSIRLDDCDIDSQRQSVSRLMQKSLERAKYFQDRLKLFGEGKIYCLIGTSTAGKTSIIQSLKTSHPKWNELGLDLEVCSYIADLIKLHMKDEYDEILKAVDHDNIFIAVFCDQVIFKENVSSKTKEEATASIEAVKKMKRKIDDHFSSDETEVRVFDKAISLSLEGKDSIFDPFNMDLFIQHLMGMHFCAPVRIGLVYCPLKTLLQRCLTRNERAVKEGNRSNMRPPMMLLFQFVEKYKGLIDPKEDQVLEVLSLKDFEETFEKAFTEEIQFFEKEASQSDEKDLMLKELDNFKKDKSKTKKELMEQIGFADSSIKKVFIVSRFKDYHHLFNTKIMKPQKTSGFIEDLDY